MPLSAVGSVGYYFVAVPMLGWSPTEAANPGAGKMKAAPGWGPGSQLDLQNSEARLPKL